MPATALVFTSDRWHSGPDESREQHAAKDGGASERSSYSSSMNTGSKPSWIVSWLPGAETVWVVGVVWPGAVTILVSLTLAEPTGIVTVSPFGVDGLAGGGPVSARPQHAGAAPR